MTTPPEPHSISSDLPAYARVPRWLVEHPDVPDRAVRVFALLTRWEDLPDGAVPSLSTIGARVGCSRESAKRAIRALVEIGAVAVEPRRRPDGEPTSNRYHLRYRPPGEEGWGREGPEGRVATDPTVGSPETPETTPREDDTEGRRSTSSSALRATDGDEDGPTYPAEVYDLTREFATLVKNNGHALPSKGSKAAAGWLREMDRLLRIGPPGDTGDDPPPPATEVREVMRWALSVSDFWPANVRSAPKFREQYTTLRAQARRPAGGSRRPPGPALAEGYSAAAEEFRRRRGGQP